MAHVNQHQWVQYGSDKEKSLTIQFFLVPYYRDGGPCFEGGGGAGSMGAIPRRQAGFYLVIFL